MPIKKIMRSFLNGLGYEVIRTANGRHLDMEGALRRLSKRNFNISTVIDVGASNGAWTAMCMKYFKDSFYFMIEANAVHKIPLEHFRQKNKNAAFTIAAAGDKQGEIFFDGDDPFGGLASSSKEGENFQLVKMTSIDAQVQQHNFKGPFLIKLDTHGFEIPILEGGIKTIKEAEILIIETYNYELTGTSLKFYEMCAYLDKLGFRPREIANPMLRKKDSSFWQMDIFFVRKTRHEFQYNSYV
jgi:FkbM family methyltransferase